MSLLPDQGKATAPARPASRASFAMPISVRAVLSLILSLLTTSCLTRRSDSPTPLAPPVGEYQHSTRTLQKIPPAGDWWTRFQDQDLNRLMRELEANSPSLKAALARYDQARGALGLARADRFPAITGDVLWERRRDTASGIFVPDTLTYSQYRAALNLDYEIDLWGRVRRSVAAAEAEFEASAADLAAAELSLKGELARTWSQWRSSHNSLRIVEATLALRRKHRELIQVRLDEGEVGELELARADTEVESTKALLLELQREAAGIEHAMAFLVGKSPSDFRIGKPGGSPKAVTVPAGLPAELLARRPDIAAAESRLRASAEKIGVVKASYLPRVTLGGVGGLSSLDLAQWFDADSLFGAVGPNVRIPIYQGGRNKSDLLQAEAAAREALANYERTVLEAVREVETAVSDIRFLDRETVAYQRAAETAEKAAELSRKRYQGGLVSQLEVIDAERTALGKEPGTDAQPSQPAAGGDPSHPGARRRMDEAVK